MTVTYSTPIVLESEIGPILQLSYGGQYPLGSEGDRSAAMMKRVLASAVEDSTPVGVILDFLELENYWGDAICTLAMALRKPDKTFIPACVVASGHTANSLEPMVGPNWLPGVAGVRIVATVDDAMRDLVDRGK